MSAFNRLPGFQRSPPGLEWAIWKRLPSVLLAGTLLPGLVMLLVWWSQPADLSHAAERDFWVLAYMAIGFVILHWTLVFTVAIGCAIVMIMKGPAYVADAYPLSHSDYPVQGPVRDERSLSP